MAKFHLTNEFANKVYDLLVKEGFAYDNEIDKQDFIYHHCTSEYETTEWRLNGKLGFGTKYRRESNRITMYTEDETLERIKMRDDINLKLKKLNE